MDLAPERIDELTGRVEHGVRWVMRHKLDYIVLTDIAQEAWLSLWESGQLTGTEADDRVAFNAGRAAATRWLRSKERIELPLSQFGTGDEELSWDDLDIPEDSSSGDLFDNMPPAVLGPDLEREFPWFGTNRRRIGKKALLSLQQTKPDDYTFILGYIKGRRSGDRRFTVQENARARTIIRRLKKFQAKLTN